MTSIIQKFAIVHATSTAGRRSIVGLSLLAGLACNADGSERESGMPRTEVGSTQPGPFADLYGDVAAPSGLGASDLTALHAQRGTYVARFDLNLDGAVDDGDVERWLIDIKRTQRGDVDLNCVIDADDAAAAQESLGQPGGWADGDVDGDGQVTNLDVGIIATNTGFSNPDEDLDGVCGVAADTRYLPAADTELVGCEEHTPVGHQYLTIDTYGSALNDGLNDVGGASGMVGQTAGSINRLDTDSGVGVATFDTTVGGFAVHFSNLAPNAALQAGNWVNASGYDAVRFSIRGLVASIDVNVGLEDSGNFEQGARYVDVRNYLVDDVPDGGGWQRVSVPLSAFNVNQAELANFALQFFGAGSVEIDNTRLLVSEQEEIVTSPRRAALELLDNLTTYENARDPNVPRFIQPQPEYVALDGSPDICNIDQAPPASDPFHDSVILGSPRRSWVYGQGISVANAANHGQFDRALQQARWLVAKAERGAVHCTSDHAQVPFDAHRGDGPLPVLAECDAPPADSEVFLGWRFSENQRCDQFRDPRHVTGANSWAVNGLGTYIMSDGFADAPADDQAMILETYRDGVEGMLFHQRPEDGLVSAGWTYQALVDANAAEYNVTLGNLGYPDAAPVTRIVAENVVTEHNIDVLDLLNQAIDGGTVFGYDATEIAALTDRRDELREGIFEVLWVESDGRIGTGLDADGTPNPFTAIDNATWLARAVDFDTLPALYSERLARALNYTIDHLTRFYDIDGTTYFGAHYFPNEFEDPYIQSFDRQDGAYHLEGTAGLIDGLYAFARAHETNAAFASDNERFNRIGGELLDSLTLFTGDRGFPYAGLAIQDLATTLPSATAAIWYVDLLDLYEGKEIDCTVVGPVDPPSCAHDLCETGGLLSATCDDCVEDICVVDPFCCNNSWDNLCVNQVQSVCGQSCGGGDGDECSHTSCDTGPALSASCGDCVANICAVDPFCCNNFWDSLCVNQVQSVCGQSCTE